MNALEKAIEIAGTQTALAEMIGAKQQHVSYWLTRGKEVPPKYAIRIERLTGGKVTKEMLSPETFSETTAA